MNEDLNHSDIAQRARDIAVGRCAKSLARLGVNPGDYLDIPLAQLMVDVLGPRNIVFAQGKAD